MKTAYKIPDTPHANMQPGETGVKMVPISRMVPRSFTTSIKAGGTLRVGEPTLVRGIAFGGDKGVASVDFSSDGGKLAAEGGPLQPSLFDHRNLAEIESPDFPGERLVVCRNPLVGEERARKRGELLAATEKVT
jgi:hypothetical protein